MLRPFSVYGLAAALRNAIRLRNLKWELPIAAATGLRERVSAQFLELLSRFRRHIFDMGMDRQGSPSE